MQNGKPNGQGKITYPDGIKYLGKYNDGKLKNVWKIFTFPDGRKYVGEWKDGKRNGQGTITTTDGGKFVGEWRGGLPWNITQYDKNGHILRKIVNGVTLD